MEDVRFRFGFVMEDGVGDVHGVPSSFLIRPYVC